QFKSGDIDLVGLDYITPDNYEDAQTIAGRKVELAPSPSVESIYLNVERPQFKDKVVRQAIYAAIDKQAILDAMYYGIPTPPETYMPQGTFYTHPDLPAQAYDPDQARRMLDEA